MPQTSTTTTQPAKTSQATTSTPTAPVPAPLPPEQKPPSEPPDAFAELDAIATNDTAPVRQPEIAPAEQPPEQPKPPAQPPQTPQTPKQLREAFERVSKERQDAQAKLAEYESKIQEYESQLKDPPIAKTYRQQLEEKEKLAKELDERLKFANYERSQEYLERFHKPIQKAFKSAFEDVSQLVIENQDSGETTQATPEHFKQLLQMPLQQAIKQAKTWFGDAATEVLAHRRSILDLDKQRVEAIEEFKNKGDEILTKRTDENRAHFTKLNSDAAEKYPQWFGKSDDPEDQRLYESGIKMADLAIEGDPALPPERMAKVLSEVRNRAAAFGRMVYRNKALESKVQELEAKLKEFESSVPVPGGEESAPAATTLESWEAEIDKLAGR